VFGQRHASSGAPLGPEFRVNAYTPYLQLCRGVAADSSGNFVVVWGDYGGRGCFRSSLTSSGIPLGVQFRVNGCTTSFQLFPSVTSDPVGNFVVAWESLGQDGSHNGVFGQRFDMVVPPSS